MEKILITGASGLIGSALSNYLSSHNYEIIHLSRTKKNNGYPTFLWDINKNKIEEEALNNIDYVIHLAGAGIADKRWSKERKKEILNSRVESTRLLFDEINKITIKPKAVIAASAIGYYGALTNEHIYEETDPPSDDFIGTVCKKWEESSYNFNKIGVRTVQLRFGVILSSKGGALGKMLPPTKIGLGSALGSGKQYIPWIHIEDVIGIILSTIENNTINGVYNVVSPKSATNYEFNKTLAKVLRKPFIMPNVPSFILKIILGEMSKIVLEGSRVSAQKIIDSGYEFQFTDLKAALDNLLRK